MLKQKFIYNIIKNLKKNNFNSFPIISKTRFLKIIRTCKVQSDKNFN